MISVAEMAVIAFALLSGLFAQFSYDEVALNQGQFRASLGQESTLSLKPNPAAPDRLPELT